jgi:hypothetical protein
MQQLEVCMREKVKDSSANARPSSFVSLLSGWAQQGVESVLATRRNLVDVASRQSAAAVKTLREGLSDPKHSARTILNELVVEGTANFIEAQRILLTLAQEENKIVLTGVKERVGAYPAAATIADRLHHTVDAFVEMQQDLLAIASKQSQHWLKPEGKGKDHEGNRLVNVAREAMASFVSAQKKFLNVIAEKPAKAPAPAGKAKETKTELPELAREAADAFIGAQKKLLDLAVQEMNVNLQAVGQVKEILKSVKLMPIANLTTEGVKDFVDAEKALIASIRKGEKPKAAPKAKRSPKPMAARRKAAAAGG